MMRWTQSLYDHSSNIEKWKYEIVYEITKCLPYHLVHYVYIW